MSINIAVIIEITIPNHEKRPKAKINDSAVVCSAYCTVQNKAITIDSSKIKSAYLRNRCFIASNEIIIRLIIPNIAIARTINANNPTPILNFA